MERITTLILKTIEDENPYRLLDFFFCLDPVNNLL